MRNRIFRKKEYPTDFRNALVRANYNNFKEGVHETTEYLELFLRNLLLDEKNELHNRSMHISGLFKADIDNAKADIEDAKANIEKLLANIDEKIKNKTVMHVIALYEECGRDNIFGRSIVERVTGLKSTRASEIINLMLENDVIESVKGHGKGKYRFR